MLDKTQPLCFLLNYRKHRPPPRGWMRPVQERPGNCHTQTTKSQLGDQPCARSESHHRRSKRGFRVTSGFSCRHKPERSQSLLVRSEAKRRPCQGNGRACLLQQLCAVELTDPIARVCAMRHTHQPSLGLHPFGSQQPSMLRYKSTVGRRKSTRKCATPIADRDSCASAGGLRRCDHSVP